MPLNLFYTMVQKKSKMTKNSNQGGSCLKKDGKTKNVVSVDVLSLLTKERKKMRKEIVSFKILSDLNRLSGT